MPSRKASEPSNPVLRAWANLTTAQAIVLCFVVAGVVFAFRPPAVERQADNVSYIANPQGGIWIKRSDDLFLCQAVADAAGQCFSMTSSAAPTYAELGLHPPRFAAPSGSSPHTPSAPSVAPAPQSNTPSSPSP